MRLVESVLLRTVQANAWQGKLIAVVLELMLLVPGSVTFRNLSRYSEYHEKTFSRGFGRRYDWVAFNLEAIRQVIPRAHEQALVLDASFIGKSGRRTYGLDRFWNGTAGRVEKGLEISVLGWLDITTNQAYSLSVEQTPPQAGTSREAEGKTPHQSQGQATAKAALDDSRIDAYVAQVRRVVESYQLQWLKYVITDGYYSKVKFIDGLMEVGLHPIGKLRGDANMRYLYQGPKRPGPGAQKRFDGKVDWSNLSRFQRIATDDDDIVLYQQRLHHPHFKRTLNVVVVVDTSGHKPRQAILFSTDLALEARTLYRYYKARFHIEFLFRDAKQATGLGDCQARDPAKLHFHFNASVAAVSLAKLEAQQQAGGQLTEPFSIQSLQRRAFNGHLLDRIIAHLEDGQTLAKSTPLYQTLCNYGTISQQAA
jgi:hypothetical protein